MFREQSLNYSCSIILVGYVQREIAVTLLRNAGHASAKSPVTMARNTQPSDGLRSSRSARTTRRCADWHPKGVSCGACWRVSWCRLGSPCLVLAGHLKHLYKRRFKFLAKARPERRQGVVMRMLVAGDIPKRQRVICRPFDLAAGECPCGVTVDQQRQQCRRMVGVAASFAIRSFQLREVKPIPLHTTQIAFIKRICSTPSTKSLIL